MVNICTYLLFPPFSDLFYHWWKDIGGAGVANGPGKAVNEELLSDNVYINCKQRAFLPIEFLRKSLGHVS